MKVKEVKIGFKGLKTALKEFAETFEVLQGGKKVKKHSGVDFTGYDALRKALTVKRLELLHIIRVNKPDSIHELARLAKRNIKNVSEDVRYLEQIGLIETVKEDRRARPVVNYERLVFEVAI